MRSQPHESMFTAPVVSSYEEEIREVSTTAHTPNQISQRRVAVREPANAVESTKNGVPIWPAKN